MSTLATAFFSGKIKDGTTKESQKAARDLANLKAQNLNPDKPRVDHNVCVYALFLFIACIKNKLKKLLRQGKRFNSNRVNVAKARQTLEHKMPRDVLDDLVQSSGRGAADASQSSSSSSGESKRGFFKDPLEAEAKRDIHRRMQALSQSGQVFEEDRLYKNDATAAEHAKLIVQGKDPAAVEAARQGKRFFARREIKAPTLADWIASMQGLHYVPTIGWAYVHTDGSLTMLQQGQRGVACKCQKTHSVE